MNSYSLKIRISQFSSLLLIFYASQLFAQSQSEAVDKRIFSKSSVFIGTQVPLQFTAGYNYKFVDRFSANVQVGILTKPYDGLIVNSLEAFGLDKYLGRIIKKAFRKGTILGMGGNYHFGNNYVGLQAQYIHLQGGGITPADALSVYFKKDFSGFDLIGLPVFVFDMQSNIFNLGALYGHQFSLRNPNLFINAEAGFSKIIASKNTFSSNRSLIDGTTYARNLYKELDKEMGRAYWNYGYIPTVSLYLIYKLPYKENTLH